MFLKHIAVFGTALGLGMFGIVGCDEMPQEPADAPQNPPMEQDNGSGDQSESFDYQPTDPGGQQEQQSQQDQQQPLSPPPSP